MATRRLAPWWKWVAGFWFVLFAVTLIGYSMGATKVRKAAATINIDRSADYTLLRLNDTAALYFNPKSEEVSVASYEPASVLFRMLGDYQYNRELINAPLARQGDWLYNLNAAIYEPGRIIAYNYKTGEKLLKQAPADFENKTPPAAFVERGWSLDPALQIRPEAALGTFERLSVPKESAIYVIGGFLLAGLLWLLALPFAFRKAPART